MKKESIAVLFKNIMNICINFYLYFMDSMLNYQVPQYSIKWPYLKVQSAIALCFWFCNSFKCICLFDVFVLSLLSALIKLLVSVLWNVSYYDNDY